MHQPAALPVVVIGGYLGAGKTTLVNHLLRNAQGRRVAVLVNDFGDVNIDADLIDASAPGGSADVLALSGGCLCCSFGDDLVGRLQALAQRQPRPDVVVIELSGVALPAAVLRTARLASGVEVKLSLVLADAQSIDKQLQDPYVGDTVRQQLQAADWLHLNKADLVDAARLQHLSAVLQTAAPQARPWAGTATALPAELLLRWDDDHAGDDGLHAQAAHAAEALRREKQAWSSNSPGARHAALFESHNIMLSTSVDLAALGAGLADMGSGVLRAKAVVGDQVLQVTGQRWSVQAIGVAASPGRAASGRLVMIGLRGRWEPLALLHRLIGGADSASRQAL